MQNELVNMIIVLERKGDRIFFGWEFSLLADDVSGFLPDQLFRVTSFNEHDKILHLKPDGKAPEGAFRISFDRNGSLLNALGLQKIVVHRSGLYGHLSTYEGATPRMQSPQSATLQNTFRETVYFDIRDALFEDGTITFDTKVKFAWQTATVTIHNAAIKKHFDAIKNYIWKLFGKRKTQCDITFEMLHGKCQVKSIDHCPLITISGDILEQISNEWIQEFILGNETDDIYPISNATDPLDDQMLNEESVFNNLVKEAKTKHYHHLRYLSSRQAIERQKLAITGKPLSFVFLLVSNSKPFLIWETYTSSEATYIWLLPAGMTDVKNRYALIQTLRRNNRMAYRRKKEPGFYFIEHNYQLPLNGFREWKSELESILSDLT